MNRSESVTSLAAALAKAQAVMTAALKDSENPHFRSKYADLASVWEACREPLTANGLSVIQLPAVSDRGSVVVETVLLHESGEWISGLIEVPIGKQDAQGVGSAITYGRRYALAAVVGVSPDDDDGEGAVGRGAPTSRPSATSPARNHAAANTAGAPQPSHGKQDESDPKRDEYLERVRGALRQLYGDDKQGALAKVEELTTFTGRNGESVKGVRDYRTLTGKRLEVLTHKLEKLAKEQPEQAPRTEPHGAVCETCGQALGEDGLCPSCPF